MIWLILLLVVVFLIVSAMPLIRDIAYAKKDSKRLLTRQETEDAEENDAEEDNRRL